jgi:uncharacterized protein YacL
MTRQKITDLGREAQNNEHERQQKIKNCQSDLIIKAMKYGFCLIFFVIFISVLIVIAYIFKCPRISENGFDLFMKSWSYIITLIIGAFGAKIGIKKPEE